MSPDGTPEHPGIGTLAIAAIVLAVVIVAVLLYSGQESYSAVYIVPDSIAPNASHASVFFVYGVKNTERAPAGYTLSFYSGDTLIDSRQFTLKRGETFEEGMNLAFPPGTAFPSRVMLNLSSGKRTEEVHFWVR